MLFTKGIIHYSTVSIFSLTISRINNVFFIFKIQCFIYRRNNFLLGNEKKEEKEKIVLTFTSGVKCTIIETEEVERGCRDKYRGA